MDLSALDQAFDQASRRPPPPLEEMREEDVPPEFSEDQLALLFSAQYATSLRYVAVWGKWFEWTGEVWREDKILDVWNKARLICRTASTACGDGKLSTRLASAKTIASIVTLARSDPRQAATIEQWDADPWLLNTPAGVVDLTTGRLRPHDPLLYMTKMTAVGPGGACPVWLRFLAQVTAGSQELVGFIQRMLGYGLTGSVREQALFFCYGTGANGKGTTLNAAQHILADYAKVATMDSFTASKHERHSTDMAMLQGARMVTAQETEEGKAWAESKIKTLTGGDPITARFIARDNFTYMPQFKLIIAGNHKPSIRNLDEAMRRRMNLVPFSVQIPREQRDKDLPEQLKAEWSGILAWMIEGCLAWQRDGLDPPAIVRDATDEYFAEQDALQRWLDECCVLGGPLHTGSTPLFQSWKAFMELSNESPGSQKSFSQKLVSRGMKKKPMGNTAQGFLGIGLRADPSHPASRAGGADQPPAGHPAGDEFF